MPAGLRPVSFGTKVLTLRPYSSQYTTRWRLDMASTRAYASSTGSSDSKPLHPQPDTDPARPDEAGSKKSAGPNMRQAPHVSEEAAAVNKSMGTSGPDVNQGTPVGEAVKNDDKELKDSLPKVMKDAMSQKKANDGSNGSRKFSTSTRSFSTSTRRLSDLNVDLEAMQRSNYSDVPPVYSTSSDIPQDIREQQDYPGQYYEIDEHEAHLIATGKAPDPILMQKQLQKESQQSVGLKFPLPSKSALVHSGFGRAKHHSGIRRETKRYESIIDQVIGIIMKDGKKARAQRHVADILTHLRTAPAPPPPMPGSGRHLVLGSLGASVSALPLDPVAYLTCGIDSAAPLMKLQSRKGLLGGGASAQVPVPLSIRQRRRTAILWLREAAEKKKGATSPFAKRFAEEVVAVVEGKSSAWEKRHLVHRAGVAGRSFLTSPKKVKKMKPR